MKWNGTSEVERNERSGTERAVRKMLNGRNGKAMASGARERDRRARENAITCRTENAIERNGSARSERNGRNANERNVERDGAERENVV